MKEIVIEKINKNFKLTEKDKEVVSECFAEEINFRRLNYVLDFMIEYKMQKDLLVP